MPCRAFPHISCTNRIVNQDQARHHILKQDHPQRQRFKPRDNMDLGLQAASEVDHLCPITSPEAG